jgi:hypothetical protein
MNIFQRKKKTGNVNPKALDMTTVLQTVTGVGIYY